MRLSAFASVKLTIALMSLIAICILIGAWCPQEAQVGFQKVIDEFGESNALLLRQWGISDLFHTPFFLGLIGMITLNMIACSVQRVFPKARLMKQKMPFLGQREISKLTVTQEAGLRCPAATAMDALAQTLKKQGYSIAVKDGKLTGEWAKVSLLAATVTHIGLLSMLTGVTITSWTGFNGFKPVPPQGVLNFADSEHSKLWLGKLPKWSVRVDDTRREDYPSGDAKQWYSKLSVVDPSGKVLKTEEISVNNPLSYEGVDIYQSSWGLDSIRITFNGKPMELPLRQMGGANAAFLPLDEKTIMIFSLRGQDKPLRIFAKIPEWQQPKMLAEIPKGSVTSFGSVKVGYVKPIPMTGLQYKADPGLTVTFTAFYIIILGCLLAAFPFRQIWATAVDAGSGSCRLYVGGMSKKAKTGFSRSVSKNLKQLIAKFGEFIEPPSQDSLDLQDNDVQPMTAATQECSIPTGS